ncbi:MAG: hypothetical protein ACP5MC_01760 [Candidatus Micrarchaeia archaeon]
MKLKEAGITALGTAAMVSGVLSALLREGPWYDGNLPIFQTQNPVLSQIFLVTMTSFLMLTTAVSFKKEKRD